MRGVTEVSIQPIMGRSWGDKHTNQQVKGILSGVDESPISSVLGWPENQCCTSRMGKGKAFWNRINLGTSRPGADLWSRVRAYLAGTSMTNQGLGPGDNNTSNHNDSLDLHSVYCIHILF